MLEVEEGPLQSSQADRTNNHAQTRIWRCGTNVMSNSKQQATMLTRLSNSWWGTMPTAAKKWSLNEQRRAIWDSVVADPSPPVLVLKWFSIAMLSLAVYHSHRDDRYQSLFLVAGVGTAIVAARVGATDLMVGLQMYVPLCALLALGASVIVHKLPRAISWIRGRRINGDGPRWDERDGQGHSRLLEEKGFLDLIIEL